MFDPSTKTWSASLSKPSQERLQELRTIQEGIKQEEQRIFDEIHKNLAGEEEAKSSPNGKLDRRDSTAAENAIAALAAQ